MSLTFSLICPSNRHEIVERFVLPSLNAQTNRSFELIVVDTSIQRFSSGAAALNFGANQATGRFLVFLHHDISFVENPHFLDEMETLLEGRSFRVAGVAGCVRGQSVWRKWMLTNIVHGADHSAPVSSSTFIDPTACDSLDECFFVIPRSVWLTRQLSSFYPCWHLYAVEYSLWANYEEPNSCLVLPLHLWHASAGASFDESYYKSLQVLCKLYREKYRFLYTPLGAWPTNCVMLQMRIVFNRIKRRILGVEVE